MSHRRRRKTELRLKHQSVCHFGRDSEVDADERFRVSNHRSGKSIAKWSELGRLGLIPRKCVRD